MQLKLPPRSTGYLSIELSDSLTGGPFEDATVTAEMETLAGEPVPLVSGGNLGELTLDEVSSTLTATLYRGTVPALDVDRGDQLEAAYVALKDGKRREGRARVIIGEP